MNPPASTPLDRLLAAATDEARDRYVRDWLQALLRSAERAEGTTSPPTPRTEQSERINNGK
jgi:hypothetical protein